MTLILRESVLGLNGRRPSCRVTLNGAPLRTTRALESLKSSVLCLAMFSDRSRLTFCMHKSGNEEKNTKIHPISNKVLKLRRRTKMSREKELIFLKTNLTFHQCGSVVSFSFSPQLCPCCHPLLLYMHINFAPPTFHTWESELVFFNS